jgi:hypothetical protein
MHTKTLAGVAVTLLLVAACQEIEPDMEALFPAQVGDYLRISGPTPDPDTGVDVATYQGPQGMVMLRVSRIGRDAIAPALENLPPGAAEIGQGSELGGRSGITFAFAGDYNFHAAWGNRDWLFVVDAPDRETLAVFLAAYGF